MRKLGTSVNASTWDLSVDDTLATVRGAGFDAFFIGYECAPDMEEKMSAYANAAAKIGLWFECIHAPFGKPGCNSLWLPGEDGDIMRDHLIESVRSCQRNGVGIAVVHLSSGDLAPCVSDIGHARLDAVIEEAVKCNVTLGFENQRKIGNLSFILELYDDVPQVRFCWDVGHANLGKFDQYENMTVLGSRLKVLHLHDNYGTKDDHSLPFLGTVDWDGVMRALRDIHYEGTFNYEVAASKLPLALRADHARYMVTAAKYLLGRND